MTVRRAELYQYDRHMPLRRSGGTVRSHQAGQLHEAFGDGEVVEEASQMGLNRGGSGIHIHYEGSLSLKKAEHELRRRGLMSDGAHVTQVMSPPGSREKRTHKGTGHFIRVEGNDTRKDKRQRSARLLNRTIDIWGVKLDL